MKFKRIITALLCTAMLGGMTIPEAYAEETYVFGDANGDNQIDAVDASVILTYYSKKAVGEKVELTENEKLASDVNEDGSVDAVDASNVLSYYAYKSTGGKNTLRRYRDILQEGYWFGWQYTYVETRVGQNAATGDVTWTALDDASGYVISVYKVTQNKNGATRSQLFYEKSQGNKNVTKATVNLPKIKNDGTEYVEVRIAPYKMVSDVKITGDCVGSAIFNNFEIMINSAELHPHDDIKVYNIKGEKPFYQWTTCVTANDKKLIDKFAKEHFKSGMTTYEKLETAHEWIYKNVKYAYVGPLWDEIQNKTWAEAVFVHKKGQCIQYNGAMLEIMAYMGFDVYMLEGLVNNGQTQHFWGETVINGQVFTVEAGNQDSINWYGPLFIAKDKSSIR